MPWGISHDYGFIFIHIPKTAGTTICSSWEGAVLKDICKRTGQLGGTHKSALQLREMFPNEWDQYYKFTVVRNPYDRFVSKFFFKQLNPRANFELGWSDKESEGLLPQMYWITDREPVHKTVTPYDRVDLHFGNAIVDKLCLYESLESDLLDVLKILGIDRKFSFPHFRQTRMLGAYPRYYTAEFKSIVAYLYREDLSRLGYSWEGPEPEKREIANEVIEETYIRGRANESGVSEFGVGVQQA
jgi:hypothetical protein